MSILFDPKTQKFLGIYNTIDHVFDGIMDLAHNYYNYSEEEMNELFEDIYLYEYNRESFEDLFESLSGVYSSYGIGFTNLLGIRYDTEEKLGDKFDLIEYADGDRAGEAHSAVKDDDRITPVGKVIRACRMDEWPQLINILKGAKLKKIGMDARVDMEKMFEQKIMLTLWVKVKGGWSDDERALKSLGYSDI